MSRQDKPVRDTSTATFVFVVDGVQIGSFMEVSGLEVSIETEDVVEGGQNGHVHKLPGRMTWPNITLKRGITDSDNLLTWLNESSGDTFASNGNSLKRHTAAITLQDRQGNGVRGWDIDGAFPVKWSGPRFAVAGNDAATEELEITHHGFRTRRG